MDSIMIMIFGAGWFIAGSGIFIKDQVFKLNAIETTGTVIGYEEQKNNLDKLHLAKIDLSDAIFVINKNNYVGDSTKKEIEYAKKHNKKIFYYTDY